MLGDQLMMNITYLTHKLVDLLEDSMIYNFGNESFRDDIFVDGMIEPDGKVDDKLDKVPFFVEKTKQKILRVI
jgi:hypothetical protein